MGGGGIIVATKDGGATWVLQHSGLEPLYGVACTDSGHAWSVGTAGTILATTDGGVGWSAQNSGTGENLIGVTFVSATHGWVVGYDGTILTTTTGGFPTADVTPPTTTVSGADGQWRDKPVLLALSAVDDAGGSGMTGGAAMTEYKIDDGPWTSGTSVTVPAPADHSGDGVRTVRYRSYDAAGNAEAVRSSSVKIDTLGPTTAARPASGHTGKAIVLWFDATDALSPRAESVVIVVRSAAGKLIKKIAAGAVSAGEWHSVRWKPSAAGSFRYSVSARDVAGNGPSKVGSARIRVK